MTDFALTWDPTVPSADLSIEGSDLATDDGLRTAVIISLFCDARAEDGDILPPGETNRRGWWADQDGDRTGSRLWLLNRSKGEPNILDLVEQYATESLKWMIDDKVTDEIIVEADDFEGKGWAVAVTVARPIGQPVTFRFGKTWDAEAARI